MAAEPAAAGWGHLVCVAGLVVTAISCAWSRASYSLGFPPLTSLFTHRRTWQIRIVLGLRSISYCSGI